eukprot:3809011-Rhodomonas_salina.1
MLWSYLCDDNAEEEAKDTTLVRQQHIVCRSLYETALRTAHCLAFLLDKADSDISNNQFKERGLKGKLHIRMEKFPEVYSTEEVEDVQRSWNRKRHC